MLVNAILSAAHLFLFHGKRSLTDRLFAQDRMCARNRRILEFVCGLQCVVKGAHNLPAPPYVILSKHQSSFETLVFPCLFPPFVWVLKQSLVQVPYLGAALRWLGAIAIDRARPRGALKQVLDQGSARLHDGISVLIFPEGTRFTPGTQGRYHVSGAALALQAGVAIVPTAHDAGAFWGAYSFPIRAGIVTVRIGVPITADQMRGLNATQVIELTRERIESMVAAF